MVSTGVGERPMAMVMGVLMKAYQGACHCGAVQFSMKTDPDYSVRCDCSLCRRHVSIMLRCDENDLEIISGQDALTTYQFNTRVAVHYFCRHCGVYTFHKMRKLPDKYGVNAGCIAGIDIFALRPILIEGSQV
jgi:hypothetical protein